MFAMNDLDIRIETHYKVLEEVIDDDGISHSLQKRYWVLFIESEVIAMTFNDDYGSDFNIAITQWIKDRLNEKERT